MAYKVGDKFVIEIDSVMTNKKGTLYGIKGFKSLVFDDYGLEQLERIPDGGKIQVGDEVHNIIIGRNGIVTFVWEDGDVDVVIVNGRGTTWAKENVERTGRHFDDVVMMLKKMRG